MTPQAELVLLAWMPVVFLLFLRFSPQKAVIISFIGGLLFLPQRTRFELPLLPDYAGMVATCYGIVLAIIVFDSQRLSSFKLGWIDYPMIVWCFSPFASSLANGLGAYDGFNTSLTRVAAWGLPYFLGRLYLGNLNGMRELALGIIKGGLIYVPLCLYEGRLSPQLHRYVYGYFAHPSGIRQAVRLGGYRPNVFMQHGLMVGMWMMTVALVGVWLWQAGVFKKIWGFPVSILVWVLLFTMVWCRSTGAYLYMIFGLVVMFAAKILRTSLPLLLLVVALSCYLYTSAAGTFVGDEIVTFMAQTVGPDRAQSLAFRLDNEELLAEHARDQAIFGWGGWGRNRVYDYNRYGELEDITTTDSLWIIAFGVNGAIGLASVTASLLLPVASFTLMRYPASTWFNPKVAPAAVQAVVLTLFMLDCGLNNMFNPVFPLISGGLSGIVLKKPENLRDRSQVRNISPSGKPRSLARTRRK